MLDVCFYNYWDIFFADDQHRALIRTSHDEFIGIACGAELVKDAQETLDAFTDKE